jgi:D-amino-acid dehydrogenase
MMPSMLPRVGRGRRSRVFYNTGHGHLGWTMAAATAEMMAELVQESSRSASSASPAHAAFPSL